MGVCHRSVLVNTQQRPVFADSAFSLLFLYFCEFPHVYGNGDVFFFHASGTSLWRRVHAVESNMRGGGEGSI